MKFWQVMEFHLKTRSLRACWIKRKLTIQKLAGLKILRIVRGEFLVEADGGSMKKIMCGQKRPQKEEPPSASTKNSPRTIGLSLYTSTRIEARAAPLHAMPGGGAGS